MFGEDDEAGGRGSAAAGRYVPSQLGGCPSVAWRVGLHGSGFGISEICDHAPRRTLPPSSTIVVDLQLDLNTISSSCTLLHRGYLNYGANGMLVFVTEIKQRRTADFAKPEFEVLVDGGIMKNLDHKATEKNRGLSPLSSNSSKHRWYSCLRDR